LKNIETRLIDGEVQVVFPSIARSHYLDVFEWSDTKLVLSTKRKLKQTLAMFAILPIALGFIFLLFVFLDDASYAHTFTLYVSGVVAPTCIGFALLATVLTLLFAPYHVFTFDVVEDEISAEKGFIFNGLHDVQRCKFSELKSVTVHKHGRYAGKMGFVNFVAIILTFDVGSYIIQTMNSVDESEKHASWIAATALSTAHRFQTHNQNMTVAARAIAERQIFGHRS